MISFRSIVFYPGLIYWRYADSETGFVTAAIEVYTIVGLQVKSADFRLILEGGVADVYSTIKKTMAVAGR